MALNSFNWDVSSPALAAIVNGNNNLGRGLEQFFGQKRAKQDYEEEQAKQRAQETTRLVTSLDTMGVLPKDVGTTKSLDELRGIRDGLIDKANIGDEVAKQQERQLRMQQIALAIAGQQQNQQQNAQQFPLQMQQIAQAIAGQQQNQQQNAQQFPLQMQQMQAQAGNADFMPVPFEVNGLKGLVSPRTGAIHTTGGGAGNSFEQRLQLMDRKGLLDEKRTLLAAHGRSLMPQDKAYYQAQIDAIDAKLKGDGDSAGGGGGASATAPNVTETEYQKLKTGDLYWWNGQQIPKR